MFQLSWPIAGRKEQEILPGKDGSVATLTVAVAEEE